MPNNDNNDNPPDSQQENGNNSKEGITDKDSKLMKDETQLPEQTSNQTHINVNQEQTAVVDVKPGDMIGPYHVLDEIGSGGMGMVFLVEQKEPVQRRLALKVIKLGMDTKDVLARFELERQALALMSHPNVAAVFDAGMTANGRPYFLMEYCPGITITNYANENNLTIPDRIRLVMQACKGVLHAHQKGILHRDLKPENILVTEKEGIPLVKIIDFGVAKSTQNKISEGTIYTQLGAFIGTPNYISPEQAGATSQEVDTRTDLYSLGIILYEILVGDLPFDQNTFYNKSVADIQKIIKDKQAPSPYDRIKDLNYNSKIIALKRKSSYSDIKRSLKGDLSCIIMHAIEKNKNGRYASVFAFDADLKAYLDGKPVEAQPHSTFYIMRRFIGRHKLMVSSITSIMLALTIGLGAALISLKHAERESAHAAAVSSLVSGILLNADPWNTKYRHEITLNQVIIELEKKLDNKELLQGKEFDRARELGLENSLQWTLRKHIGDLHSSVGNYQAADNNYRQAVLLHKSDNNHDEIKIAELNIKRSNTLTELGKLDIAEELFNTSFNKINPPQNKKEASILLSAKGVYKSKGEVQKSIEFNKKLLAIASNFFTVESKEYIMQLLRVVSSLFQTFESEKILEALKLAQKAKKTAHELTPRNVKLEARASRKIVDLLAASHQIPEAISAAKEYVNWSKYEFGETHIQTLQAHIYLARTYAWSGDSKSILDIINYVEPILAKAVEIDHYLIRNLMELKGGTLVLLNRFKDALVLFEKGLAIAENNNNIPSIVYYSSYIATSAYFIGELTKAQYSMEKVIENEPSKKGWNISIYHSELAQIHLANLDLKAATKESIKSLELDKANFTAYTILGLVAYNNKDYDTALKQLEKAKQGWLSYGGEINDANHNELVADIVLMFVQANKIQEAYKLAKTVIIQDLTSISAAAVQLKLMAAKVANGETQSIETATSLYEKIDSHWARITWQNKAARRAAILVGVPLQ